MSRTTEDRDSSGDPTRDPAARTRSRREPGRAVDDLAADVTGPVHEPHGVDAAIELAGLVDAVPADLVAVLGAVDSADVASAVRWAAAHGTAVLVVPRVPELDGPRVPTPDGPRAPAPRTPSDGPGADGRPTLVVTCRRVDRVVVDVFLGTARVGVGAAWSAVDAALGPNGLPTGGLVGDTVGRLAAVTTLRGAIVVTADGLLHRVDDEEEPELWEQVLRGAEGGARAVVVTELELELD